MEGWTVLLIGGSSGTGKTVLARQLARRLGVSLVLVDDVRLAVQAATTPTQQPALHRFLAYTPAQWLDPDGIVADWHAVAEAMQPPLHAILAHHLHVPTVGPLIIEGDAILPAHATPAALADLAPPGSTPIKRAVRAIFLEEPDEAQLLRNLRARGRGFEQADAAHQLAFAHASWRFGHQLAADARALHLPVLPARPHESALERLLASL